MCSQGKPVKEGEKQDRNGEEVRPRWDIRKVLQGALAAELHPNVFPTWARVFVPPQAVTGSMAPSESVNFQTYQVSKHVGQRGRSPTENAGTWRQKQTKVRVRAPKNGTRESEQVRHNSIWRLLFGGWMAGCRWQRVGWEDLMGEDCAQSWPRGLKPPQRDPQLVLCPGWVLPEHEGASSCVAQHCGVSCHIKGGGDSRVSGWGNAGDLCARTGSALTCLVPLTSHIPPWPQFPPM